MTGSSSSSIPSSAAAAASADLGGRGNLATANKYVSTSLSSLQHRLKQLRSYVDDYLTLSSRLTTLLQRTRHEVMVPLGPLAFQPGYIHHTNEVLVLLGEGWLANRSSSQAQEIIKPRIRYLKKQIDGAERAMKNSNAVARGSKAMFGADGGGFVAGEDEEEEDESGGDTLNAKLGVRMNESGRLVNEEGEEIVEIREKIEGEEQVQFEEEKKEESKQSSVARSGESAPTPSSSAASSSSSSSASSSSSSTTSISSALKSGQPLHFPSALDAKNFDEFWDQLAELEKQQEEMEEAAGDQGETKEQEVEERKEYDKADATVEQATPVSTSLSSPSTLSSTSTAIASADPSTLSPIPSPALAPITHPGDIYRAIRQAKSKSGVDPGDEPFELGVIPPPTSSTSTATRKQRSDARATSSSSSSSSASSSRSASSASYAATRSQPTARSTAVAASNDFDSLAASRSLDAAFAEYKAQKREKKKKKEEKRTSTSGQSKKSVRFAADVIGGEGAQDSSDEVDEEEDNHPWQPAASSRSSRHSTPSAASSLSNSSRAAAALSPFSGDVIERSSSLTMSSSPSVATVHESVQERMRDSEPLPASVAFSRSLAKAASAHHQPSSQPYASHSIPLSQHCATAASSAPPKRISKFKARMLGLATEDDE